MSSHKDLACAVVDLEPKAQLSENKPKRELSFWLIFLSLGLSIFLAALELAGVSVPLPVIVDDLGGTQFAWIGSAYALAATAFIPMSGGLAQCLGRRPVMLGSLLIFALGSALCGVAPTMNFLIAGRAVQGLGGGGIASLTQIIVSDLVPLQERGIFNGLIGIGWSLGSSIAPIIGGSLAQHGHWRWLFYLNIPICLVAATLVLFCLRLRTPSGTFWEKMGQMDWIGNALVISSTSACIIALTWGGIQYSWTSAHALVPLVMGLVGLGGFVVYEVKVAKNPLIPFNLMSATTTLSGYLQAFLMALILLAFVYYLPVYYQACRMLSPTTSGLTLFGLAFTISPVGIAAGITVAKSHRYRPQMWLSWVLIVIGAGLFTTVHANTARAETIGFTVLGGAGIGILSTTAYFPVLAPLPISANAKALAFYTFIRNFAQVWGVTIGGAVLQNGLKRRLPEQFASLFPKGTSIAYAVIPVIPGIEQPLRDDVRYAFAGSLSVLWAVLAGFGGLGLISSLFMKGLPLHTDLDKNWGMVEPDSEERQSKV